MAAVTATILIGNGHPNENSINPQWIIKLWEGDRANWIASSIDGNEPDSESRPRSPEEILETGCRFAARIAAQYDLDSVLICALDESSIARQLADAATHLPDVNIHLMRTIGSRTSSQWREGWQLTGVLAQ